MNSLIEVLAEISDNRRAYQISYPLPQVIALVIIALLAGMQNILHIEYFSKTHSHWIQKALGLQKIPSDTTISRILQSISIEELETALMLWIKQLFKDKPTRKRLAIDSKRMANEQMLTRALILGVRQLMGSSRFNKHQSEIKNISKLLKRLYLKGYLISIDAIGTHKELADLIVSKSADYILPVKGNQKSLCENLKFFCDNEKADSVSETIENSHGRFEKRKVHAFTDVSWLKVCNPGWESVKSFCLLESYREEKNKPPSTTFRVYICSRILNAEEFLYEIRSHWDIENKLHWPLNQSFHENKTRLQNFNAMTNFSILLTSAITLLAQFKDPKISFNLQRFMLSWNLELIEKCLYLKVSQ